MPRITVMVLIQNDDGNAKEYRHDIEMEQECTEKGVEAFASELFDYAIAEFSWHRNWQELKPVEDLTACPPRVSQEPWPTAMFDIMNR